MSYKRYQNPKRGYSRADRRRSRAAIAEQQSPWLENGPVTAEVGTTVDVIVAAPTASEPPAPVQVEEMATTMVRGSATATEPSVSEEARFRRVDRLLAALRRSR